MFERSAVAIIIPAYNEEKTIGHVVKSVAKYGVVIVVDDFSNDQTGILAKSAGAMVVRHSINQGYDKALNSGFIAAQDLACQYAVTFDADGQHCSELLESFISYLIQDKDLVVGVRPNYARIAEHVFGLYTRYRFGLIDPLCGMKGYRMSLFHERGWFDSYCSIGTELMLYSVKNNKKFIQLPIPITSRQGASRFGQKWRANFRILRAMMLSRNAY